MGPGGKRKRDGSDDEDDTEERASKGTHRKRTKTGKGKRKGGRPRK